MYFTLLRCKINITISLKKFIDGSMPKPNNEIETLDRISLWKTNILYISRRQLTLADSLAKKFYQIFFIALWGDVGVGKKLTR